METRGEGDKKNKLLAMMSLNFNSGELPEGSLSEKSKGKRVPRLTRKRKSDVLEDGTQGDKEGSGGATTPVSSNPVTSALKKVRKEGLENPPTPIVSPSVARTRRATQERRSGSETGSEPSEDASTGQSEASESEKMEEGGVDSATEVKSTPTSKGKKKAKSRSKQFDVGSATPSEADASVDAGNETPASGRGRNKSRAQGDETPTSKGRAKAKIIQGEDQDSEADTPITTKGRNKGKSGENAEDLPTITSSGRRVSRKKILDPADSADESTPSKQKGKGKQVPVSEEKGPRDVFTDASSKGKAKGKANITEGTALSQEQDISESANDIGNRPRRSMVSSQETDTPRSMSPAEPKRSQRLSLNRDASQESKRVKQDEEPKKGKQDDDVKQSKQDEETKESKQEESTKKGKRDEDLKRVKQDEVKAGKQDEDVQKGKLDEDAKHSNKDEDTKQSNKDEDSEEEKEEENTKDINEEEEVADKKRDKKEESQDGDTADEQEDEDIEEVQEEVQRVPQIMPGFTKTGKKKKKPFRGLKYSFGKKKKKKPKAKPVSMVEAVPEQPPEVESGGSEVDGVSVDSSSVDVPVDNLNLNKEEPVHSPVVTAAVMKDVEENKVPQGLEAAADQDKVVKASVSPPLQELHLYDTEMPKIHTEQEVMQEGAGLELENRESLQEPEVPMQEQDLPADFSAPYDASSSSDHMIKEFGEGQDMMSGSLTCVCTEAVDSSGEALTEEKERERIKVDIISEKGEETHCVTLTHDRDNVMEIHNEKVLVSEKDTNEGNEVTVQDAQETVDRNEISYENEPGDGMETEHVQETNDIHGLGDFVQTSESTETINEKQIVDVGEIVEEEVTINDTVVVPVHIIGQVDVSETVDTVEPIEGEIADVGVEASDGVMYDEKETVEMADTSVTSGESVKEGGDYVENIESNPQEFVSEKESADENEAELDQEKMEEKQADEETETEGNVLVQLPSQGVDEEEKPGEKQADETETEGNVLVQLPSQGMVEEEKPDDNVRTSTFATPEVHTKELGAETLVSRGAEEVDTFGKGSSKRRLSVSKRKIDEVNVEIHNSDSNDSVVDPKVPVEGVRKSKRLSRHSSPHPLAIAAPSSPEGATGSASKPEATLAANVADPVLVNILCKCRVKDSPRAIGIAGEVHCQAIDSFDGRMIGCCHVVTNYRYIRVSGKIPFMLLCSIHRQRLRRHNCCPMCGLFCTQGQFLECKWDIRGVRHHYHKLCGLPVSPIGRSSSYGGAGALGLTEGKQNLGGNSNANGEHRTEAKVEGRSPVPTYVTCCPHCGSRDASSEVNLELKLNRKPVVYLTQQLEKREGTARMTWSKNTDESVYEFDEPEPDQGTDKENSLDIGMGRIISSHKLPEGLDKEKLKNAITTIKCGKTFTVKPSPKAIYWSCKQYDLEKLLHVLTQGVSPNVKVKEYGNQTGLHVAATYGNLAAIHILSLAQAALDLTDSQLMTPLMVAIIKNHNDIVLYLIQAGASLQARTQDGMTCLHLAAKNGNLVACRHILDSGRLSRHFVNVQDEGGWTPLVWASENRFTQVVKFLLDRGGNPQLCDVEQNTALHWAAFSGSTQICTMVLDRGCSLRSMNAHGDTPLHIAARQDHTDAVGLLLARGASTNTLNKKGQTPIECTAVDSQAFLQLQLSQSLQKKMEENNIRIERILSSDIAAGKEEVPIPCVNGVDDDEIPKDYLYLANNCEASNVNIDRTITSLKWCECEDGCNTENCGCGQLNFQCWFDPEGRLLPEFNFADPPMIFECNRACRCNKLSCNNRVVQHGITAHLQLFKTEDKGWGVRALKTIQKGSYVCEYVGEIITDLEADQREDDSYLFDLDNRDSETFCLDARSYGNIARFINHLCIPNLTPVKTFIDHQDLAFPRIALFANRDIEADEELGFDYGEKFWIIKYKHFTCTCGSDKCKYSSETIYTTLENYNKKAQEMQGVCGAV